MKANAWYLVGLMLMTNVLKLSQQFHLILGRISLSVFAEKTTPFYNQEVLDRNGWRLSWYTTGGYKPTINLFSETPFSFISIRKRVVIELKIYIRRFFLERCEGVYSSILSTSNIQFYCVYFGYLQKKTTINKKVKEQAKETNKSISEVCRRFST